MTATPPKSNLLECFVHWEKTTPDRVYLTQPFTHEGGDGRVVEYTWGQVGDQVRRMAAHLESLKLPRGSSIALLGKNSAHWVMADLAIWMAGHVTVPMYPTLNTETARYIFEHAEVKLLFVGKMDGKTDSWNEMRHGIPAGLALIGMPMSPQMEAPQWDAVIARHKPMVKINQPGRNDLATIVYTSGSTGQPKGVMHGYGSMTAVAKTVSELYALTSQERMLSYLPLAHVAERAILETTSLYFGFQVFFAGDLSTFQADLQRARPTVFFSVPRLWTKFYLAIQAKLPERKQKLLFNLPIVSGLVKKKVLKQLGLDLVRVALTGSAPLPPHIIEWYRGLGLELLDVYGMSENFGVSHASRLGEVRVGYVGSPAPNVKARIAGNGELQVISPGQMLGYYKQPELTASDMTSDGFFKTGDRGELDDRGRLRITGRVKELFKTSKGKYVAPVPIEARLGQSPRVEAVCLTGPGQPQTFALLMLSLDTEKALDGGALTRETLSQEFKALLDQVNATLEDHERMDYVVVAKGQWTIESGMLTPTMKIRRSVIEARYLPRADGWLETGQKVIWE